MVEEMEEEETEEEGLEYMTDTPSGGSYMTLGDSDPENNTALRTEELEARTEAFLEEAKC